MKKLITALLLAPTLAMADDCQLLYSFEGHEVYQCGEVKKICQGDSCKAIEKLEAFDADEFIFGGESK